MKHRHGRSLMFVVMLVQAGCSPGTETTASAPPASSESSPTATVQDIMELSPLAPLETGTYFMDPDLDSSTPLRVVYEVPEGWLNWIGATKSYDGGHVMVSITTVTNLVRHGCRNHLWADPPLGPSVN